MKKSDKNKVIILGIIGAILLVVAEIMIYNQVALVAMGCIVLFVIVCFDMVAIGGKKDDQTATIEQLSERINDQSRRIMATEGLLAKYKRQIAELSNKNEA